MAFLAQTSTQCSLTPLTLGGGETKLDPLSLGQSNDSQGTPSSQASLPSSLARHPFSVRNLVQGGTGCVCVGGEAVTEKPGVVGTSE